jgi:hypothetical protein
LAIPKTEKEKNFYRKTQKKFIFCFQNRKGGKSGKKLRKKTSRRANAQSGMLRILRYEKDS